MSMGLHFFEFFSSGELQLFYSFKHSDTIDGWCCSVAYPIYGLYFLHDSINVVELQYIYIAQLSDCSFLKIKGLVLLPFLFLFC